MTDPIGALRARVMLQRPVRTPDDLGGAALSWADEGAAWADIAIGGASSAVAFDAAPSILSLRLVIRRRADIRAGWRVVWGARVLRVIGVSDENATRITLFCEEETL